MAQPPRVSTKILKSEKNWQGCSQEGYKNVPHNKGDDWFANCLWKKMICHTNPVIEPINHDQ